MRFLLAILFLCAAFGSFGLGMAVRHYEIPPYMTIRYIKNKIDPDPTPVLAGFSIDPIEISERLEELGNDSQGVRNILKEQVVLPKDLVQIEQIKIAENKFKLSASLYGIRVNSELNKTHKKNATCLRIYVQGHNGNPFDYGYHNEILNASLNDGCDFLSMSMLGLGLNLGPASFPAGKYSSEVIFMPQEAATRHGNYLLYHDKNLPELDYMALFLSPHYYTIQSIIGDYQEVAIMGISGGGWYTVWMAALIDKIDTSIVYAGSLPMVYRTSVHFFGDYEEVSSNLYRNFNYWELYYLGSLRDDKTKSRNYHLVFNDKDECCFMDPAASHFKMVSERIYPNNVSVRVERSDYHDMNSDLVLKLLRYSGSTS